MIRSSQISKTKIEKEVLICWEGHLNHSTLTKTDECVAVQHVVIQRCVAARMQTIQKIVKTLINTMIKTMIKTI